MLGHFTTLWMKGLRWVVSKYVRMIQTWLIRNKFFDEILDSLIKSGSVKCSLISNRTSISLRKHNAIENSNLQGNFNIFNRVLIEDFDKLEKTFFAEGN